MKYLVTINIPKSRTMRGVFRHRIFAEEVINLWLSKHPDALANITKISIPFKKISNFDQLEAI